MAELPRIYFNEEEINRFSYYCEYCDQYFQINNKKAHKVSKKHHDNVYQYNICVNPYIYCVLCAITLKKNKKDSHCRLKKHIRLRQEAVGLKYDPDTGKYKDAKYLDSMGFF